MSKGVRFLAVAYLRRNERLFLFYVPRKGKSEMKIEGQVRIPSCCAIAAVIFKEGKRMS